MTRHFTHFEEKLKKIEKYPVGEGIDVGLATVKVRVTMPAVLADTDIHEFANSKLSMQEKIALADCHRRISVGMKIAIFEIGHALFDAKALIQKGCESGAWSRWLASLEISEATARNYMAAVKWERQCPKIRDLPRSVIYLGAAAPNEVKSEIERRLQRNESVTKDQVKDLVKTHRQAAHNDQTTNCVVIESADSQIDAESRDIREASQSAHQIAKMLSAKFQAHEISKFLRLLEMTSIALLRRQLRELN